MNKRINEIAENWREKLKGKDKTKIIVIIGLIGIVLIFLSTLIGSPKKAKTATVQNLNLDTSSYKEEVENNLSDILSQIQGVGEVKVMLTIEGTTEYVFAEEENSKQEDSTDKHSSDYQNKYVMVDKGGTKEALVKKILKPKINGVIVVCEGGDSPIVCEKVYKAVSAVLGIPVSSICVVRG